MLVRRGGRLAFALALALAGCAAPEQVADSGDQYAFRVARTPYSAARCITDNLKTRPGTKSEEKTLGDSGMEVVVRGSGGIQAVAKILRDGTFSSVNVLVTRLISGDRNAFARSLVSGC